MLKYLLCIGLLISSAWATVRTAATCSETDVQTQITASSNGDTVIVPAGTCTYVTGLTSTVFITLRGTSTNIVLSGVDFISFDYHNVNSVPLRVTGFNISGSNSAYAILVQGKPASYHLDHLTFTNLNHRAIFIGGQNDSFPPCYPIYGLMDHITWTQSNANIPAITMTGCNEAWRSATDLGTANANYIEDSSFTYTAGNYSSSASATDCEHGCKYVVRHSTVVQTWLSTHDTGSTPQSRGVRQFEEYANTMTCAGGCGPAMNLRGGTGVKYDNSIAMDAGVGTTGFGYANLTEIYRNAFSGGVPWDFLAGAETHLVGDLTYESMRLYCSGDQSVCYSDGASCGGAGTCKKSCTSNADLGANGKCVTRFDGAGASGYPVRDQTGVGPDANDGASTQTAAADPVYLWNNTDPNSGNALITSPVTVNGADAADIVVNREFYVQGATFNGTTGVGRGLLSARPATCTTGVAYWETDGNRLDKCTGTNTWTNAVYVPYVYPHPLQGLQSQTNIKGNASAKGNVIIGGVLSGSQLFAALPTSYVNSGLTTNTGFCSVNTFDAVKVMPGDYPATTAGLIQAKTDQVAANQWWLLKITAGTNIHSGTYTNSALITWPTSGAVTKCLVVQSSTHNTDGVTVCSRVYPTTRNANCTNDAGKMWKFTIDNSGGTYGMLFPLGPAYILLEDVEIAPAAGTNQSANSSNPQLQLAALGDHFGLAYSWIHGWNPGDAGQPAGACATAGSWNRTGLVDTNGTTVTRHVSVPDSASGDYFGMDFSDGTHSSGYPAVTAGTGNAIIINGVSHGIASHDPAVSATTLTIDSSAGTQTGVTYTMVNPATAYATGCGDDSRGIQMNCTQCFAGFSYFNKIHWWGGESHAISLGFSSGPVKLFYNYIEAGSNGIFSGGAGVDTRGGPLQDFEVGNTIVSRDLGWRFLSAGSGNSPAPPFGCGPLDGNAAHDTCPFNWAIKNNIELKECNRCVFYAVIAENSWPDGQSGSLFAMTVRVASGGESAGVYDPITGLPATMLKNVRIQDFWARNASQFLGFGSRALDPGNGGGVSLPVCCFNIVNGLITNTQDTNQWGAPGTDLIQWSTNGQKFLATMSRTSNVAHAVATAMKMANYDPGSGNIHNNYGTYNKAFDISSISSTAGNVVTVVLNNLRHDPTIGGSWVVANVPGWNGTFTITSVLNTGSSMPCSQDNNGNPVAAAVATQPQPCIRADGTFGDTIVYTDNTNHPGATTLCSTKLTCDALNSQAIVDTLAYKVTDIGVGDGVYTHDCTGGSLGNPALFQVGATSRVAASGATNAAGLVVEYPNAGVAGNADDSGATCVIENSSGWPAFVSYENVTVLSPNITSINSNGLNSQHFKNQFFHNIFAMTGAKAVLSCTGIGTEGTASYACWDSGTFTLYDNILQGRNPTDWSVSPGGSPVNSFPLTVTCSGATATNTCLGYTKWMSGVAFPTTNCVYNGSDPTNCLLMAAPWQTNFSLADIVPVATSSYQTEGVDVTKLLNAFAATQYVCPTGGYCGSGPKPD